MRKTAPPPPPAGVGSSPRPRQRRPGPSNDAGGGGVGGVGGGPLLNSIYQCVDAGNYSKVLRLTSPPPPPPSHSHSSSNDGVDYEDERNWDIVRALRAHALERSGRVLESLAVLCDMMTYSSTSDDDDDDNDDDDYDDDGLLLEIRARMSSLSTSCVVDGMMMTTTTSSSFRAYDPIRALDARVHGVRPHPPSATPPPAAVAAGSTKTKASSSSHRGTTKGTNKSTPAATSTSTSSSHRTKPPIFPPITDAIVLQTMCVTLRNVGLYVTISELYKVAFEYMTSSKGAGGADEENYVSVLRDGIMAHLKASCDVSSHVTTCTNMIENDGIGKGTAVACDSSSSSSSSPPFPSPRPSRRRRALLLLRSILPKLDDAYRTCSYRERMQSTCQRLAMVTHRPLHYLWTAMFGLWHRESLVDLAFMLERSMSHLSSVTKTSSADGGDDKEEEEDEHEKGERRRLRESFRIIVSSRTDGRRRHHRPTSTSAATDDVDADMDVVVVASAASVLDKMRQKIALLPRLAESLSSRIVLPSSSERHHRHDASENDWDVYVESLLVQGKKLEALGVLEGIRCAPTASDENNDDGRGVVVVAGGGGGGDDDAIAATALPPRIDDETSISDRLGSILPYTRRRKMENMAKLSCDLGMRDVAECHYRELLSSFPDQWTYWTSLIECTCLAGDEGEAEGTGHFESVSSSSIHTGILVDEAGWQRCVSFSKELIMGTDRCGGGGGKGRHELRGPYLIYLELIALKLRHTGGVGDVSLGLVTSLCDEICKYGDKFGPSASCCFADLRPYVRICVRSAADITASFTEQTIVAGGECVVPHDVLHLLLWAKEMWATNSQSNDDCVGDNRDDSTPGDVTDSTDALLRDRRKRIRRFIFAVQVVFDISNEFEDKKYTLQLIRTYAPSIAHMVIEWRTSLSSLPGVSPKDGGQKEVLPGDEIILLASQYLLFEGDSSHLHSSSDGPSTPYILQAASLLEEAIDNSPYNPHLKIAAISVYSRLGAAERALAIYQDLGVKQIQLDSCSYIILPLLVKGGLYTSAIKIASSILRLHGSSSKDIKGYASDSLENGLMFKANEMVTFQREKMRLSVQLLHSKALLMDAAPLMIPGEIGYDIAGGGGRQKVAKSSVGLASEKGFCGSEEDLTRAEQLVIDGEMHFNAPSIIHAAAQAATVDDFASSDNRDMTLYFFESLYRTSHMTPREMVIGSLRSGHTHGLMVRAVMSVGSASAPKKGKVPTPTEERSYRCLSLSHAVSRAREFRQEAALDEVGGALWDACCHLCEVIIVVVHGNCCADESSLDTLAEREVASTAILGLTTQLIQSARLALSSCVSNEKSSSDGLSSMMGARVCQLLPDYVVPLYVFLETAGRLFALFGWGKRKRLTKIPSGALAKAALSLQHLISDMLQVMSQYRSFGGVDVMALADGACGPEFGIEALRRVIKETISSREATIDRVDSFLLQMKDGLNTFNDEA